MKYTLNEKKEEKSLNKRVLLMILLVALIGIFSFFIYPKISEKKTVETTPQQNTPKENEIAIPPKEDPIEVKEIFETIGGQLAFIAIDTKYQEKKNLPIVIYSHGSTYSVTSNPDNQLLKDLRLYADAFVKKGYIFAASNQHGDNWGNDLAIEDTRKLIEYIQTNFTSSNDLFLIGFSMGGLPTLNFAQKYPENIVKIALLAPTSYATNWSSQKVKNVKEIPIKIWHGDMDVNVPYSMTTALIARFKAHEKEVILETVSGMGHWDVDTEKIGEVLEFFTSE